jgi:hypothetical protein
MDTLVEVTPALAVLVVTVVAALTLRHLLEFRAGLRNMPRAARPPDPAPEAPPAGHMPRYRVQPVLIVLTTICKYAPVTLRPER